MAAHGRAGIWGFCVVLVIQQGLGAQGLGAQRPGFNPFTSNTMRADARLVDVCFVDVEYGWAVGDRGTIWHTSDQGRNWHLQRSNVDCRLESVFFANRKTGWIVGGYTHPYTHDSSAVILLTTDGGKTWQQNQQLLLPALKKVGFLDTRKGWALGDTSAMFPAGMFITEDGGRSWKTLSGALRNGWTTGDMLSTQHGGVAGRSGLTAVVRRAGVEVSKTVSLGLKGLGQLKLVPPVYGWLVGQGGLIMMTADGGISWQTPPVKPPEGLTQQFDFSALAVRGPKAWIAGSPGTRVLHSPDAGHTWIAFATGQNLPLYGLSFADDRHGWAVGEFGTILATQDGGRTWTNQHSGGRRAALLGLFAESKNVPLELFAKLSGNDGYLSAVEIVGRRDVETLVRSRRHPADRIHEAMVAVGGSSARTAWQFPLRQSGLNLDVRQIVAGWDRANDGRGQQELDAYLVRQIRLWRPNVIVTNRGNRPLESLISQSVSRAIAQASDPTLFSEQITQAGLEPWSVSKVFEFLGSGATDETNVTTSQLAERLGRSLADVTTHPRGLIHDRFQLPPITLGFRAVVDRVESSSRRPDFFTGIPLSPGGKARRLLHDPPTGSLEILRRLANKRRNVEAILNRTKQDSQSGLGLLAEVGELTRGLDSTNAVQTLFHLSHQYQQTGQWPLSAKVLTRLVERYPKDPLARSAEAWLIRYYSSSEAAWRVEGSQRYTVQQASFPSIDFTQQEDRANKAANWGQQIARTRPDLYAEPSIRFPLAAVDRRRGFPKQAERYYFALRRGAEHDAWRDNARVEKWLSEPVGLPPKPVLHCVKASTKPRLDGHLDEPVWKRARPAKLNRSIHESDALPAVVLLAYDDEFLYLAVQARQAPKTKPTAKDKPRTRDTDLSRFDRVELLIDLDRDYTTYYHLTVDRRGWTHEQCWGDATWDPTWFVASKADADRWTAEVAIPLDQLTGRYPKSRSVWAVGIQRIIPGVDFQSWNTPASVEVTPKGFGVMIFE